MKPEIRIFIATIIVSFVVSAIFGGIAGMVASKLNLPQLTTLFSSKFLTSKSIRVDELSAKKENEDKKTVRIEEESATIDVVKSVSPAVVSIVVTKKLAQTPNFTGPFFSPFNEFFGFEIPTPLPTPNERPSTGKQKREVGGGTGFIISSDGLILTNKHVIADPEAEYSILTVDGKRYDNAKVLAQDPFVDIAILKIEATNLPIVALGNSDEIQIGETVIAIGNTLSEYHNTVTKGVISGIKRRVVAGGAPIGTEVIEEAIQTDAAINPGNSGGPLVNLRGQVIGINTAISREGQLIGFAIPSNIFKSIIESVKEFGRIVRPWLGVRYIIIDDELASANRLPVKYGALVIRGEARTDLAVIPGSPADRAGIRENDIILELDDIKITRDQSLASLIQKHKPEDKVKLKMLSQGNPKNIEVTLVELK